MNFEDLKGKKLLVIEGLEKDSETVYFTDSDNMQYVMHHHQGCCENVRIEDVTGDVADVLDSEILMAEEISEDGGDRGRGSSTWTFYKLATIKGSITIRWLGESNGYYSESVDFHERSSEGAWCL